LGAGVNAQAAPFARFALSATSASSPKPFRTYLKFNAGDAYDPGKIDQSIRALFATGLFADVRIDREGNGVVVTVVENPVINQVAFEGNKEVDKDTLKTEVQLKPRAVFTRAKAQADVQRVLDVYRRQGRVCRLCGAQDH
jgi:outer membrane protein insertion porin family